MRETILTILAIVGGIILAPLATLFAPIILALADEEELRENGYFLSSRERDERHETRDARGFDARQLDDRKLLK